MPRWEYCKIDIATSPRRGNEIDLLNDAGSSGWELVGITSNSTAYLKRALDPPVQVVRRSAAGGRPPAGQKGPGAPEGPPERN